MKLQIIIGSVRDGRIGPLFANWAQTVINENSHYTTEIIDLKDWYLPMDDEPGLPAEQIYLQPHTQKWSRKINEGDAYLFIFPQYNWGYPAALKNAIDHLYIEWKNKPASMISYANRGGGKAAAQLRQVLNGLDMQATDEQVEIKLSDLNFDDLESQLSSYNEDLIAMIRANELLLKG